MHCVMSQITIKLSDKADALIVQLQKEIFNRRRKKVTAAGVVETLVESGAKSQSDKRFATSWTNLIKDIEKAAKLAYAHGSKPSTLTDEEWALVLSHRSRSTVSRSRKTVTKKLATKKLATKKPARRTRTRTSSKSAAELSPATREQAAALKAG
jgi:topoisomerase IA-like protein